MSRPLELVCWRDAHFYKDPPDDLPNDYIVKTVGWVREGERFLAVASEKTPDGDRAITYVPNESVIERTRLTPRETR